MKIFAWSSFSSIRRHLNDVNVIFYVAKWSSLFTFLLEANVISVRNAHCTKNHTFFLEMFWKYRFFKKWHWNMIFVVLSWKMVFVFPRIWSYSLDGKWKMFFLKNYVEIWYFLYIWYRWYFFFLQYDITLLSKKQRWFSPENVHLKIIFPAKSKKMIFIPENCFLLIDNAKVYLKFQRLSVLL